MRRRLLLLLGLAAILAIAAYEFSTYDPDAPQKNWPRLEAARTSDEQVEVLVGPNVQISPSDDSVKFWECVIAADPNDPSRLVSAVIRRRGLPEVDIFCFYSHDGGHSWNFSCERICPDGHAFYDPTVAFGPDGQVFLAHMDVDRSAHSSEKDVGALVFMASTDGGKTWQKRTTFPNYVDRPWLAVDCGNGRGRGNIYCIGQVQPRSPDGQITHGEPIFFRSTDGLRTLSQPVSPHLGRQMVSCRPANPVVFPDGMLLVAYQDRYLKRRIHTWPRPAIYTANSFDGGQTFEESSLVNAKWWHDRIASSEHSPVGAEFPALAVDFASRKFNGSVYCVWSDGSGDDGTKIFFSASHNRGREWSDAIVVSEQPMLDEKGKDDYVSFVPTVAVNNDGVVAVGWYDRRNLPATKRKASEGADVPAGAFNLLRDGWNFRVRLSLDGGRSWLPSVQVNESSGQGNVFVGHTAGLVADAKGRFHAAWIDNRIGNNKLWTASMSVTGREGD
jgi:hypothetical protein